MNIILLIISGFLLFCITWVFYLAVMNLKRNRDRLTLPAKIIGYPVIIIGYLIDILLNLIVGTILFLQPPKELTFTARMKRNKRNHGGWRFDLAYWICENLLNPFDPSEKGHC